jgi:hypothetical protein
MAHDTGDDGSGESQPTDRADVLDMDRREYMKAVGATVATGLGMGAASSPAAAHGETITSNQTGTHDGYFYSFWTDEEGTVEMTLGTAGNYELDWNNTNSTVCGLGWETGARRNVEYEASTFDPGSNGYLCLYGWTTDPLVEYYIIEDHGPYQPGDSFQGTVDTDGGTYDIYTSERVEKPSIVGTATFTQYWSIRQSGRTSGTITTGNHFDAWADNGMDLGSHDYQIMATEAYQSTGSSDVSVGTAGSGDTGGGDDGSGDGGSGDDGGSGTQQPYNGTPHAVPGRIQAEEYDQGGSGVAYSDNTAENEGGALRTGEAVDISSNSAGSGYSIGYIESGEWVEYTVDVEQAGEYTLDALVASDSGGGAFHVEANGQNVSGNVSFGATGGWDSWETVSTSGVSLDAGQQVIRVAMDESWWDLNYLDVSLDGSSGGSGDDGGDSGGDSGGDGGDSGGDGGDSGGDGGDSGGDLVAEIDPDTTSASVGERVAFRVSDTTGSGNWIDSLSWSLGNGDTGAGWYTDTTYDSAGSYTVQLDATNNEGTTTTDEVTITIS